MSIAWALAALLLFSDASHMRDYLELAGRLGLRGKAEASTPLRQAYPAMANDAMTWVRHSLSLAEGDRLRLRHTQIDNAPDGREVHWNSGWAWAIAGAGRVQQMSTGGPLANAVEKATVWLNPLAFMIAIVALSAWTARHAGALAGVFVAAATALHERIAEGFLPGYVDHHGLLTACVLGIVLGAVAMGAGWWRAPNPGPSTLLPASCAEARAGAFLSAVSGAVGLWISAASVVPAIALTALAGIAIARDFGPTRARHGESFDAAAWRLWGRVGAAGSFAFYLAEYFPDHLSWHLEANHPLYALAWLAGGELVARVGEGRLAPRELLWPVAAALAPLAVALAGGARVLAFADPFLAGVHKDISEFRPLWSTLRRSDAGTIFRLAVVDALPLGAAAITLALRRGRAPVTLAFATLIAGGLLVMAWWQTRWHMNASAAQIPLALALIAYWTGQRPPAVRWACAAAVVATLYAPGAWIGYTEIQRQLAARSVRLADARVMLSRDIAGALRAGAPQSDIVVLASPNVSTRVGYYGRMRTLGTLYWENNAGLRAAAEILSEESDERACTLLAARRVTHIVFVSNDEFLAEYYTLLHPDATPEGWLRSLGGRIAAARPLPRCVLALPYEIPSDLEGTASSVRLFKVVDGGAR